MRLGGSRGTKRKCKYSWAKKRQGREPERYVYLKMCTLLSAFDYEMEHTETVSKPEREKGKLAISVELFEDNQVWKIVDSLTAVSVV